jgi:hypothetical protein
MFTIYNLYISVFSNSFFYLGTLILNGVSDGLFFILGGVVILVNWMAVVSYVRTEREMFWAGLQLSRELNNMLEDSIIGVDSIRCYKKNQRCC